MLYKKPTVGPRKSGRFTSDELYARRHFLPELSSSSSVKPVPRQSKTSVLQSVPFCVSCDWSRFVLLGGYRRSVTIDNVHCRY
jgi:hypothetical protein